MRRDDTAAVGTMDETAAASPTPTPSTPTTLGDASAALAMADSSLATPAPETPAANDAPAATQQAQTETPEQVPVSTEAEVKGEPPKWRWQDILANARETAAKEADAKARQEYEWAKEIQSHERDGLLVWRAAMNGDPQAIARIKSNPQAAQWIKGLVDEPQTPQADPMPEPDLQAGDGSLVYSHKAQQAKDEWLERRLTTKLMGEFEKKLQPFQTVAQTFQQREAQATYTTNVSAVVAKMKAADPAFEKHMPDVGALLNTDARLMQMAVTDPESALELAWNRVYRSKVLPSQQQQDKAQVLTNLQRQAVAATTNPATASATAPKQTLGDAHAALAHATAVLGG